MGEEKILKATHAGTLKIGELILPCAVLEDGMRVITERGMAKALGRRGRGRTERKPDDTESLAGPRLPLYLSAKNLESFVGKGLRLDLAQPIIYRGRDGGKAHGIKASLLPEVCEVWLRARDAGVLFPNQERAAQMADVLMRGLAHIGIIALVDEATGYQEARDRNELHKILEAYISKELLPWTRRFPPEFYQELFRLRGWQFNPLSVKRPSYVGTLTNELVYEKLPPGVLEELQHANPVISKGRRRYKHHQFLTEDIGNPHLEKHLLSVITLMHATKTWAGFMRLFDRVFPPHQQQMELFETDEIED